MSDLIRIIQFSSCTIIWFFAGLFSCESVAVCCIKLCATLASVYCITLGKTFWCSGHESSLVPTPTECEKVLFSLQGEGSQLPFPLQLSRSCKPQPDTFYMLISASCTSEIPIYWTVLPSTFWLWGPTVSTHHHNDREIESLLRIGYPLTSQDIPE